jgi:hypothetical protein
MVKLEQGRHARVDDQHDIAAPATAATIGPAKWFEFLPQDRGTAVATVATLHMQGDLVNEGGHG